MKSNGNGKPTSVGANAAKAAGEKNGVTVPGANGESLNTVGDALLVAAGSEDGIAALLRNGAHVPAKAGDVAAEDAEKDEGSRLKAEGESEEAEGGEQGASTDSDADVDTATETETTESAEEPEVTEDEDGAEPGTDAEDDGLTPKLQERINRRIGKEVAKRKALQERLEAAEARIAELADKPEEEAASQGRGGTHPYQGNPLEHVTKLSELERLKDEAEQIVDFTARALVRLKRSPEAVAQELKGYQIKLLDAGGEEDYSPERMEEYLSELKLRADQNLRRNIPRREKFLEEKADWDAKAAQTFPYLKQPKSKEYQESRRVLESFPELKRHPKSEAMIGVYMLGLEELRRRTAEATSVAANAANAAKAKAKASPPRLNGSARVAAPRVDAKEARTQASTTELVNAGGSEDALTKVIGNMLG